jgi:hypothetical protein
MALTIVAAAVIIARGAVALADVPILDITQYQSSVCAISPDVPKTTVMLSGKINHSGHPSYQAVVPGVSVWIAELPDSGKLGVKSDEAGWWKLKVLKYAGIDAELSPVYEKTGWITTKSNAIRVGDSDATDLSIQYIDPVFFKLIIRPLVEMLIIKEKAPKGADKRLRNAIVATIGKKWASIHDDRLPHGDPGAVSAPIPGAIGPVYFDKHVRPDPSLTETSVDGGVTWINAQPGEYVVGATKEGYEYEEVKFVLAPDDAKKGIVLYIASPPRSIQGTNESAPGKP